MTSFVRRGRFRVMRWLDAAAATWIGYALPPVRVATRDAKWRPDRTDAYCTRCGGSAGEGEATSSGCAACRDGPAVADLVVRLGVYDGVLRDWILGVKYGRWDEMAVYLGRRLAAAAADRLGPEPVIVTAVPMPPRRRMVRGFDHAAAIAEGVAAGLGVRCSPLLRIADGSRQGGRGRAARRRAGGRGLRPTWRLRMRRARRPLEGRQVVLVDDVMTTGTTVRRAARRLRALGAARVIVAVAAVAGDSPGLTRGFELSWTGAR